MPTPQEAKSLQAKQRRLEADLQDSRAEARAAAAHQEQAASLAAELAAAQREAAAASEQLRLAHSRGATLEQAYANAMQVGGRVGGSKKGGACVLSASCRMPLTVPTATPIHARRSSFGRGMHVPDCLTAAKCWVANHHPSPGLPTSSTSSAAGEPGAAGEAA